MFQRLDEIESTYRELESQLGDADVLADGQRYTAVAKRHAELGEVVDAYRAYRRVCGDLEAAQEMVREATGQDRELMRAEAAELEGRRDALAGRLRTLLLPRDPNDDRDVIVEIRAGAGGDEAGLFAGELWQMYTSYAERQGWRTDVMALSEQGIGGVKEVIFEVRGEGAYSHLKHESGVHRVQRVPRTESQGRIHTSTATVAVLPAAEEVDVEIDPAELRIDVFRSSGPGGQSVNTTDSAVRLTHLPTGLVVSCQDEKSQHQNREKAMRILRARLLQAEQERVARQRADARKGQIGSGDRSEKIRTYNFPQSRVTDHRIGMSVHNLQAVLSGELDELVEALTQAERAALLAGQEPGA
ncbi:MAG TPA: peptide chain release factor 1 [Nitriliruptorales bacterium]|nr:peptide chain release factor 1 [Nitriliruptorales bacterium]